MARAYIAAFADLVALVGNSQGVRPSAPITPRAPRVHRVKQFSASMSVDEQNAHNAVMRYEDVNLNPGGWYPAMKKTAFWNVATPYKQGGTWTKREPAAPEGRVAVWGRCK